MIIFTSQFNYHGCDRVDITYKTIDPLGQLFSPSKELVWNYKENIIQEKEYKQNYINEMILNFNNFENIIMSLLKPVTFVCYCNYKSFCHRFLIIELLLLFDSKLIYGGEKKYNVKTQSSTIISNNISQGYLL